MDPKSNFRTIFVIYEYYSLSKIIKNSLWRLVFFFDFRKKIIQKQFR